MPRYRQKPQIELILRGALYFRNLENLILKFLKKLRKKILGCTQLYTTNMQIFNAKNLLFWAQQKDKSEKF
jgi:hypothetical protein